MSHIKKKFEIAILGNIDTRFGKKVGDYFTKQPSMAHGRSIACKQIQTASDAIKVLATHDFDMVVAATSLPFEESLTTQSSLIPALQKYAARRLKSDGERHQLIMLLSPSEYRNHSRVLPRVILKQTWRCLVNTMGADRVALAIASYLTYEFNELKALQAKYPYLSLAQTKASLG